MSDTSSTMDPTTLPVIVISGLGAPRVMANLYGRTLRKRGFRVYTSPQYHLGYGDVRRLARGVGETVDRVRDRTGAPKVHLVGMSLGGLVGLYHLKCGGDASAVDRFVSVGGPLNGSTVARLAELVPVQRVHAIAQTCPDSALMLELRAAPAPAGVRMYSVGTRGDVLTPRSSWDAVGLEPVPTEYGAFPIGHWMLFTHPGNHRVVADLLSAP